MPNDNRISASITPQVKTEILAAIEEIRTKLPMLINLTAEERHEMPKMGPKTIGFDEQCASYMASNPELLPAFVDPVEVNKDRALRLALADILRDLRALTEGVDDTLMVVASEAYMADLSFYQNVRQAAKRGVVGADTVYNELQQRFPGHHKAKVVPPPPTS